MTEDGIPRYTKPTILISVVHNTLTRAIARELSKDILVFLDSLHTQNVDIAFYEAVCKFS